MTLERLQRSDMQPIFGVARHRAYTPMSSIDPLQGACSPDVISTNMNLAGSSDGVAEGDPTTNLAMNLAFNSTYNIIKEKSQSQPCTNCTNTVTSCGHRQCKLCSNIDKSHHFTSSNTGRTYHIDNKGLNLSCNSSNVIYLITCNYCRLQYVGETSKTLKVRFNNHRSAGNNKNSNKLLYEHFNSNPCSAYGYKVQIIEKIDGSGHLENGKLDPSITQIRQNREEYYMKKLRTIFPYGLNDRYKNKDFRSECENIYVCKQYFGKLENNFTVKKRSKKFKKIKETPEHILKEFSHYCKCYDNESIACAACTLNFSRIKINSLNKSSAKQLGSYINDLFYNGSVDSVRFIPQYFKVFIDLIESKFTPVDVIAQNKKKFKPELPCKIFFSNKYIQDINLERIFRDKRVLNALPSFISKAERPTVVYKYAKPIRNCIFNYKETIANLDVQYFIDNYDSPCECENSIYIDKTHNHIITGNLNIVENVKLRNLLKQGPQFREQPSKINFKKLYNEVKKQIKDFLYSWADKYKISVCAFDEWKINVFKLLKQKINNIQYKTKQVNCEVLKDEICLKYLKNLHTKFVVTPVDKASNNIAITCKKYYIKTILSELGLFSTSPNMTYAKIDHITKEKILDTQFEFNKSHNIRDNQKVSELPFMYAIPKFHKNPIKFRFIISSMKCQTKPLAKVITKGLKLCQKQHEVWCKVLRNYTGINHFFIIDKNQPIIDKLNKLNIKNNARSIETFDFSTLYTMIKHTDLKENLEWFIEKAFNGAYGKGKKYMSIYSQEAKWVNQSKTANSCIFSKDEFVTIVNFLIDNSFFEVGNIILQQNIGIPMGTDPAPYMANGHLYKYEFAFQDKNRKTNYKLAKSLNYTYRYIDDVTPINDSRTFFENIDRIYPNDLILTKENIGSNKATVLDLDINITNNKFDINIYDKTDTFNFEVVKYPSIQSNIPNKCLYTVFYSQAVRYLKICNKNEFFLDCLKKLTDKCINKGANLNMIKSEIRKLFLKRKEEILKLHLHLDDLITCIS